MRSQLYSWLKFLIGWPFILLAFFFIFRILYVEAPTLLSSLHQFHTQLLGLGVLSFIIFYFLRAYVWHRILQNYGYHIPFRKSCYLWSMSELKRYIPGSIWAFMGRAFLFEQAGVKKKDVGRGLIIEAELFVVGCVVIAVCSLPLLLPSFLSQYAFWLGVLIISLVFFYCFSNILPVPKHGKLHTLFTFLLPGFAFSELLLLVVVSSTALFFFGLANYFVISSITYLNPQLLFSLIGTFVLAFVAGYLSIITPAGLGVREGIMIFALLKVTSAGLAALGAVFSRIILILSELVFIGLSYVWNKVEDPFLRKFERYLAKHPQTMVLTGLALVYTIYFNSVSFLRYDNFYTGRFDLGNMAQTVWNSFHGKLFLQTDPNGTAQVSRLAFHADFILVLLAPFYAFWQNPKMLLLIQTLIVVAGAFFIYTIAREVLKHRNLALLFAFVYLLNPSIERANIYDFHAVTLVTTFLLGTYYFFLKKRYTLFIIFAVLSALCKEQIWLIIALFGLLVFFVQRQRILGVILFVTGCVMFYFLLWYAIPKSLGAQHFALAYFSDYGANPTQIVKGLVMSPNKIITTILEPSRTAYLTKLFEPVGYLSIFFPLFLIFAAPDLLINMLSNNKQLHEIYYQYTATITPFLFLCAVYGVWVIRKFIFSRFLSDKIASFRIGKFSILDLFKRHFALIAAFYLLFMAVRGAFLYGPLPGAQESNLDMFTKPLQNRIAILRFLAKIPKSDSVSASNDLGSHLSHRETIYTVPAGIDRADVIVLILTDPKAIAAYQKVMKDPHYKKVKDIGNFVAFERVK